MARQSHLMGQVARRGIGPPFASMNVFSVPSAEVGVLDRHGPKQHQGMATAEGRLAHAGLHILVGDCLAGYDFLTRLKDWGGLITAAEQSPKLSCRDYGDPFITIEMEKGRHMSGAPFRCIIYIATSL